MPPEHQLDQAHPEAVDWVLGTLSAAAASQFQQHLTDCHPCQVAVAEFGQLGQMLQNLPPAVEPSSDLEARTVAGVLAAAASEAATTHILRASPLTTSAAAADKAATTQLRPIPKAPTPADEPRSIQPSGMPTVPPEISHPLSAAGQPAMGRPTGQGLSMAALTFIIEPDEYEALSALIELGRAADDRDAHRDNGADVLSKARTLMRTALAGKLEEAGLPWAPSGEAVKVRAAEARQPPSDVRRLVQDKKVRKYAAYVLAVGLVVVLWGGYVRGWHWTGFEKNNQLWDWLQLLLIPVAVGTIPLWIRDRKYIGKGRRVIYAVVIVACGVFVIAGYLIPLTWTGFGGQTLWSWFGLLLLPMAVTATTALTSMRVRGWKVSLRRYQKALIVALAAGWILTVIGGYALHWKWTGYGGNTLWDWLMLLLLPLVFPTILLPALLRWITGDAEERAKQARERAVAGTAAAAGRTSG